MNENLIEVLKEEKIFPILRSNDAKAAIETAKENERGIVDIETLQTTQNDLIETIQETLRIQKEGKEKRRHAEVELGHMEDDLKQKLLDLTQ